LKQVKRTALDEDVSIGYLTCDFSAPWVFVESEEFLIKNFFQKIALLARMLDVKYLVTVSSSLVTWPDIYVGAPPALLRKL
jgi:hypothetical protein